MTTTHKPATPLPWNVVAGSAYVAANAYPRLIAALHVLESNARVFAASVQNNENEGAILSKRQTTQIAAERARALLRELGEDA